MSSENEQKRKLTKEEQQKVILGILLVVFAVAGVWQFGLKKILASRKAVEKEIAAQRKKYDDSKLLVDAAEKVQASFEEQRAKLREIMSAQVPPSSKSMFWTASLLREVESSEEFSLRRESISEKGVDKPRAGRDEEPPVFEDYKVQMEYTAGYHDLGRFLAKLEKRNSFVRIDSLEIGPNAKEEGKLLIRLACAFPRFTDDGFPAEERPDAPVPASEGEEAAK